MSFQVHRRQYRKVSIAREKDTQASMVISGSCTSVAEECLPVRSGTYIHCVLCFRQIRPQMTLLQ